MVYLSNSRYTFQTICNLSAKKHELLSRELSFNKYNKNFRASKENGIITVFNVNIYIYVYVFVY